MVTIIDKQNRSKLAEGRNNGMAFAFLKKIEGKENEFKTVMPPSPCKDYLAEVIITENTGYGTRGCGLSYPKKLNIFSDVAYMSISILKTSDSSWASYSYSNSFNNDVKKLAENYKNLQKLINNLEKTLKLSSLTTIKEANNNKFLVTLPIEWTKSTHSISLYSLLLRVGMFVENPNEDIVKYVSNFTYNTGDKSLCSSIIPKLKLIIKNKMLPPNTIKYNIEQLKNKIASPHDNGIQRWNSSFEEVEIK